MTEADIITADDIRQSLIARATAYRERTGMSFSNISEAAVKDSKFLANVQRGENFTVRTYQRVTDWLTEAEARLASAEASA